MSFDNLLSRNVSCDQTTWNFLRTKFCFLTIREIYEHGNKFEFFTSFGRLCNLDFTWKVTVSFFDVVWRVNFLLVQIFIYFFLIELAIDDSDCSGMSSFTRASTFIVGPEGGAMNESKSPLKKVEPSKIPQLQLSKHNLMFQVRKIPRPSSRRLATATKRSESSTSVMSSRPSAAYHIKHGRQSYAGRMKRASHELRMKKIEESLLKKNAFSWRAFMVIALLFLLVLNLIFFIEVDVFGLMSRKYPVNKMLRIVKGLTKEAKIAKVPFALDLWTRLRDWIALNIWELKSKLAVMLVIQWMKLFTILFFSSFRLPVYAEQETSHIRN